MKTAAPSFKLEHLARANGLAARGGPRRALRRARHHRPGAPDHSASRDCGISACAAQEDACRSWPAIGAAPALPARARACSTSERGCIGTGVAAGAAPAQQERDIVWDLRPTRPSCSPRRGDASATRMFTERRRLPEGVTASDEEVHTDNRPSPSAPSRGRPRHGRAQWGPDVARSPTRMLRGAAKGTRCGHAGARSSPGQARAGTGRRRGLYDGFMSRDDRQLLRPPARAPPEKLGSAATPASVRRRPPGRAAVPLGLRPAAPGKCKRRRRRRRAARAALPLRYHLQPRRAQPDRLDRIARLQQHEVGVAARPRCRSRRGRITRAALTVTASKQCAHPPPGWSSAPTCRPMCATSSMSPRAQAVPRVHHAVVAERDVDAGGHQLGHARHAAALRIAVVAALQRDVDQRVGDRR